MERNDMETQFDLSDQYAEVSLMTDATGNSDLRLEAENGDIIVLRLNSATLADIFAAIANR